MNKVAVVGLGYVGLPLAALGAIRGFAVVGLEANSVVVDTLKSGRCHIRDETVESLLEKAVKTGNFLPTSDVESVRDCDTYLICVPTPVDANQDPDLEPLISAVETIGPYLAEGDLVVVESTVFPGTCEEVVLPLLERVSGLEVGADIHLAHCPERVNPGDAFWSTENIPRVVGATSAEGVDRAAAFYSTLLGGPVFDVREIRNRLRPKFKLTDEGYTTAQPPLGSITKMRSIRDAEAVKAMENTVRDVNIAFVNELAKISDVLALDVVDIIDGMSTKPFGKGPFFPGVGVGGHCIAVDPEWLKAASKRAGYMPEMIQLSRQTNNYMPEYTVSLLQDALNDRGYPLNGTEIAVLGVAYKRDVDDPRESPFYEVRELLERKGAAIRVYDGWYAKENTGNSLGEALKGATALLLVTDHKEFVDTLSADTLAGYGIDVVVDGRNCLDGDSISAQGIEYRGVGRR